MVFAHVGSRRVLLAMVASLIGLMAILPSGASASAESESPIVAAALRQVGTHGGQCWTFMREVVAEATGQQVGFDYRQGFFEAGAVEVSADEAIAGDIIQIASDANTSPSASYAGLHTAIVMENLGGGRFNAVDSNQNWDEMVQLRPNYDPFASAARYGLQVHIYRIPGGGSGAVAATNVSWTTGDGAVVQADPGCLNLRASAALDAERIACLPTGTAGSVLGGPAASDGFTWVKLQTSEGTGWVAALYLEQASAPAAAEPAFEAVSAAAEQPTARVDDSPGCLRLRGGASLSGAILNCLGAGTALQLLGDDPVTADGYEWIHVRTGSATGWVANQFVIE